MARVDPQTQREVRKALRQKALENAEATDKSEGWIILRRFKNSLELALFTSSPGELADLEYKYPLASYRRKLDLDNKYLAVLRR